MGNAPLKWTHKDEWRKQGTNYLVMVTRHAEEIPEDSMRFSSEGVNRWAVYAYIYPAHPMFAEFSGEQRFQPATAKLHLHGNCSFLRYHFKDRENVSSVQVGADYHHLHDERFTHMETCDDAFEVFHDAEKLFAQLQQMTEESA